MPKVERMQKLAKEFNTTVNWMESEIGHKLLFPVLSDTVVQTMLTLLKKPRSPLQEEAPPCWGQICDQGLQSLFG